MRQRWLAPLDHVGAPRLWCAAVGLLFGVQGIWAFVAPRSFFDTLATFEPFNAHFVRDVGADPDRSRGRRHRRRSSARARP